MSQLQSTSSGPSFPTALQDLRCLTNDQVKLMKPRVNLASAFDPFWIDDPSFLEECDGRSRCGNCGQSRKYFCYTCHLPLERYKDRMPRVQLPFLVDLLKHPRETPGKSTAVHAAVLAPEHAKIYTYPDIPDYRQRSDRVILIFPGPKSTKLESYFSSTGRSDQANSRPDSSSRLPFDRVVLIDCTWNQVKRILLDERLSSVPRVELSAHHTLFWRYQTGKPTTYLATVEALYYTALAVHRLAEHAGAGKQAGRGESGADGTVLHVCGDVKLETREEQKYSKQDRNKSVNEVEITNGCKTQVEAVGSSIESGVGKTDCEQLHCKINVINCECANNMVNGKTTEEKQLCHHTFPVTNTIDCENTPDKNCVLEPNLRITDSSDTNEIPIRGCEGLNGDFLRFNYEQLNLHGSIQNVSSSDGECCGTMNVVHRKMNTTSVEKAINKNCIRMLHENNLKDSPVYLDECCHQFDNLLFLFKFMFFKIHNLYGSDRLRAYK